MNAWAHSQFAWWWLIALTGCAGCQHSEDAAENANPSSSIPALARSAAGVRLKPAGADALPEEKGDSDDRDVRWLLRPPLRGAPLDASNEKAKEVPIPHAGLGPTQPLPILGPETTDEASRPEAAIDPRPNAIRSYPQNVADKPVPRLGDEPWLISEEWRVQHERHLVAQRRTEAKVVFLGDSITAGWRGAPAYREAFAKYIPLNLGVAGDHTQNVLWRIQQGTLDGLSPQVVVVMIGVNNLGGGFTPEATVGGVQAVVSAVQERLPRSRILLLAILPARHSPTEGLRSKITDANRLLARIGWPGSVSFRDVGSVFLDSEGKIAKTIMRDFLHPTAEGYQLLSTSVDPLIQELLEP